MSTVQVVAQVSSDRLLEAIGQMDLAELDRLVPRVIAIRAQRRAPRLSQRESELLTKINRGLPINVQTRLNALIAKRQAETLTPNEHKELLRLIERSEKAEAARVEALARLAQLRSISLTTLMHNLGIKAPAYA